VWVWVWVREYVGQSAASLRLGLETIQKGFSPSPEQAKHTSSSTLSEIGPLPTKFHDEVDDENAGFIPGARTFSIGDSADGTPQSHSSVAAHVGE